MRAQISAVATRRAVAGLGVALALTLSAAACGSSANTDKLVSKMKSDAAFKTFNDSQLKCLAGVVVKYGKKSEINDYINGKAGSDSVNATNPGADAKGSAAAEKCLTKK